MKKQQKSLHLMIILCTVLGFLVQITTTYAENYATENEYVPDDFDLLLESAPEIIDMHIAEVPDPATGLPVDMAFVACTYTNQTQKLLMYQITDTGDWIYDDALDLPLPYNPQFADMEIRADGRYLYIALPEANEIYALTLDVDLTTQHIPANNPVDLALIPYSEKGSGLLNLLILENIIEQTPDEVFDDLSSRDLILDSVTQLEQEFEQIDVLDTIEDTMTLRTLIQEKVVDEVYLGFMIKSVDTILMVLINSYLDQEDPLKYTAVVKTVVDALSTGAFDVPGNQNQIINRTNELEQKLTTDKYHFAADKAAAINQLVNDHVADQEILTVLNHVLTGLNALISEIERVFDKMITINNSIYAYVESLDDAAFTNPGGRAGVLTSSQQLESMLDERKLDQSLIKVDQLENSINHAIVDEVIREQLLERSGDIRTILQNI